MVSFAGIGKEFAFLCKLEFKLLPYTGIGVKYSVFVRPTGAANVKDL